MPHDYLDRAKPMKKREAEASPLILNQRSK
jgi:hypothetical protein